MNLTVWQKCIIQYVGDAKELHAISTGQEDSIK